MYGRKDLVKITALTNLSAILRTIKKCLGYTPPAMSILLKYSFFFCFSNTPVSKGHANKAIINHYQVVEGKELAIAQLENQKNQELLAAEAAAAAVNEDSNETSPAFKSPNKEKWKSIIEIPDIASYDSLPNGILKKKRNGFDEEPLV